MIKKIGIGKISEKSSGRSQYKAKWLYIPSKIAKDIDFPFNNNEKVQLEILDGKLIVSKKNDISNIIQNLGLQNATIPYLLEKKAIEKKNKLFLYYKDKTYSYVEVNRLSNRVAHGLIKLKKEINQRRPNVALMVSNSPEFLFCWFGLLKAGCVSVHVNNTQEIKIITHIINDSNSKILILDYNYIEIYEKIKNDLPHLKKIILINSPKNVEFKGIFINFSKLLSKNENNPDIKVKSWHLMEVIYSAGATRIPKGVIYREFIVIASLVISKVLDEKVFNKHQKVYCPLPLYNGFVRYSVILPALYSNSSIVLSENFDELSFWDDIKTYKPTGFCYFGRLLSLLLKQPPKETDRQNSLKWAFGSVATKELWERFENRFEIPIYEGWTLSEGAITINKAGTKQGKRGSIGKPVPGCKIKIVDKKGKKLPPGPENVGEILSRQALPIALKYNNIVEDVGKNKDGNNWIHTGDLGYSDKDGYIYFLGRKKDIIHRKGRMVNTRDVEKIANSHPFVLDSVAFGLQNHEEDEEDIKICVVLKRRGTLTHEQFFNYLNENLAYYMIPRYIEFKKKLFITPTERVKTYNLKKEWEKEEVKRKTWDADKRDFVL